MNPKLRGCPFGPKRATRFTIPFRSARKHVNPARPRKSSITASAPASSGVTDGQFTSEKVRLAREVERLGIGAVILFGLPESKDPLGREGYADDGVVQQAVGAVVRQVVDGFVEQHPTVRVEGPQVPLDVEAYDRAVEFWERHAAVR